jgi:Holliday junction resolvasome RuvABC ATP-dependent DNA helicase subunit
VKSSEVEIKPFIVSDFTQIKEKTDRNEKVSKKELKRLAKEIGLDHNDEQIQFSKKLIENYLAKR